ncbi:hypothetical protein QRD43_09190 [Pelomonas sp. APW6]|uniref:Two-component sensor histidine kinase n=1 Tax=Roseateles subflavus TaxID=3053353 RepID=A0ABT7LGU1_9BURK|nr:hypothetical protein [Pelomonas sp. APW6]MDL5032083.1 hypothetical protein [Pelomonas sp. APW6]
MSRRWRLGLALLAMAGLLGLSCHQYQSLQAALPLPLQPDPRAAEYQALRKLAVVLSRSLSEPGVAQDEVLEFRARQRALGLFSAYVNSSPFRSELLLVADKPAWTEGWLSAAAPTRLHEGLSGEANWIIPVTTGLSAPGAPAIRWSLQVRSLEATAPPLEASRLQRHLGALLVCSSLAALLGGLMLGRLWRSGRDRDTRLQGAAHPAWDGVRTDLGPLDDAVSDHMRLRGELARQSEELAAVTEAVRLRREQRRREGQPA